MFAKNRMLFFVMIAMILVHDIYTMTHQDHKLISFLNALQYGTFVMANENEDVKMQYVHFKDNTHTYTVTMHELFETYNIALHLMDKSYMRLWSVRLPEHVVDRCFQFFLFINNEDMYQSLENMQEAQTHLMHIRDTLIYEGTLVPQEIVKVVDVINRVMRYCEHHAVIKKITAEEVYQELVQEIKNNRIKLIKSIELGDVQMLSGVQQTILHLEQVPVIQDAVVVPKQTECMSDRKIRHQMRKERRANRIKHYESM